MVDPVPVSTPEDTSLRIDGVKDEDVAAARAVIHDKLVDARHASDASGKPLAILVGEYHYSTKSALLESVIYDEARKLNNVHDVAIEYPSHPKTDDERGLVAQLTQNPDDHNSHDGSKVVADGGGMQLIYQRAIYAGDTPHLVDDKHDLSGHYSSSDPMALVPRNATMADNIAAIPRPVMDVVGTDHLEGLAADMKAKDTHEVVVFDVSGTELRTRYTTPPKGTTTLTLEGDMGSLNSDRIRKLAMGEKESLDYMAAQYEQDTVVPVAKPATPLHPYASMLDTPDAAQACSTLKASCSVSTDPQATANAASAQLSATQTPATATPVAPSGRGQ